MGLKDIGSKLPPGFRFHPSDEELVCHYLCNKIRAKSDYGDVEDDEVDDEALKGSTDLVEIDLHICEPWELPDVAKLNAKEWNRAPNGIKTTWIMHEFRLECPNIPPKEDWVLCRVFNKGRDSSLQDNNYITDNQTQRPEVNDAPDLNYNNQLPPLLSSPPHQHEKMKIQVCDQWEQLMKEPSRTTDQPYHHHCHHHTIACGWEQMMIGSLSSSSSHGPDHESLINLLYVNNNNSVNISGDHHQNYEKILLSSPDMTSLDHDKTCMGSSSDGGMVSDLHMECGGLSFETENLLTFH
ncbi:unnamed protein product [Arabidopsis arenosa]|uniref:NAC domain-containing protein n=1 Tax=Arabidopsis arenosa TaxID=38785 RepID=A0A8S2ARI2_ARAAE|nr:unnamed protein product [Arabidopsis arenosa]